MKKEQHFYQYEGPVTDKYGKILAEEYGNKHNSRIRAVSDKQAKAYLSFNWKKNHGYDPTKMNVQLPGKITLVI